MLDDVDRLADRDLALLADQRAEAVVGERHAALGCPGHGAQGVVEALVVEEEALGLEPEDLHVLGRAEAVGLEVELERASGGFLRRAQHVVVGHDEAVRDQETRAVGLIVGDDAAHGAGRFQPLLEELDREQVAGAADLALHQLVGHVRRTQRFGRDSFEAATCGQGTRTECGAFPGVQACHPLGEPGLRVGVGVAPVLEGRLLAPPFRSATAPALGCGQRDVQRLVAYVALLRDVHGPIPNGVNSGFSTAPVRRP